MGDMDEGHVATGRFSNGKLITDFLVSKLGLMDLLPAYLDPMINNHDLLTGVSFASAGSGFDDLTAEISNVIRMEKQIEYFGQCKDRISESVGVEEAERIVNDAVFLSVLEQMICCITTTSCLQGKLITRFRVIKISCSSSSNLLLRSLSLSLTNTRQTAKVKFLMGQLN